MLEKAFSISFSSYPITTTTRRYLRPGDYHLPRNEDQ